MMLTQKEALVFKLFLEKALKNDAELDDTTFGIINDVRDQIVAMDKYWRRSDLRSKQFEEWLHNAK